MKKFKVFALVFAIMLSATGLGILFGSNQPASTQAKVSAEETTTLAPGIYTVDSSGKVADKPTKPWADIAKKSSSSGWLYVNLSSSDGTYLVCGALPEGVARLNSMFAGKKWLTDIVFTSAFNTSDVTNMSSMFSNCSSLTSITFSSGFDTSKVTDMSFMFFGCSSLTSLDLSNFDTSNVTDMSVMFGDCSSLTSLDLKSFNTNKVQYMSSVFDGCSSLTSITFGDNFDTSKVTSMVSMFDGCSALTRLDLSSFDTSNVTGMYEMFENCTSLTSITFSSGFDTSKVTDMHNVFSGCSALTSLDLSNFNTSKVEDMMAMFYNCSKLTGITFPQNFGLPTAEGATNDMSSMFSGCTALQNIKMPNTMNAESDITLSALSLPSQNASETAISWYSLASDAKTGIPVVADKSVSSYAGNILTIDNSKSFNKINKDVFGVDTPAKPETPSTGVVLDVVLPAFSIVLVLASLVAVAFVGKKKKQ